VKKHYHIFFSGIVQGVGFRYTARAYADKYKIYGKVLNLNDGRVELDIEGDDSNLNAFLIKLKEEFSTYIKDIESKELLYTGKYIDFQIEIS
jgi:acylphosphatase